MIEEITKNIYRMTVKLPNNPLRILNSYLIRGEEDELLIDTGFRHPECQKALREALDEVGSVAEHRDVLCTHLHTDHSGMADLFAGPGRSVYMSEKDFFYNRRFYGDNVEKTINARYYTEGFSERQLLEIYETNPAVSYAMPSLPDNMKTLKDGDIIQVGDIVLQTVMTPGHTPGNAMFWIESEKIMFTGDNILFDITPNITSWDDVEDSLGDYLESLDKAETFPVEIALPGHRETGDYFKRIRVLKAHHKKRLDEAYKIVLQKPGLTAYDITGKMQWQIRAKNWAEFPLVQKWFAVGECLAHLDYLMKRGLVTREFDGNVWRYRGKNAPE